MRREVLSKNRYGSAATRRTLRILQGAVKRHLSRSFVAAASQVSVQVGEASAGVRLGVLHPAQEAGEDIAEGGAVLL
jgi:hypothetical protein